MERDPVFRTRLNVPPSAWVAPSATLVGDVTLGERVSVWYGCVLRGDLEPIEVGDETNVQDGTIVHVDRGSPARIGRRVTIGHRSVVHGCVVEDEATIGMGAVLLSGSKIGKGALVAAGALVTEGFEVPDGMIAAGVPAKLRGKLPDKLAERFKSGVESYLKLSQAYREGRIG